MHSECLEIGRRLEKVFMVCGGKMSITSSRLNSYKVERFFESISIELS